MDNDGLKDIFISNGIYKDLLDRDYLAFMANETNIRSMIQEGNDVITKLIDAMPSQAVANQAFRNEGDFGFPRPTQHGDLNNPPLATEVPMVT